MARFKYRLKKWYDKVPDWIWPHLTGEPTPPPSGQLSVETRNEALLGEIEHVLDRRMGLVDERLRNVETKLVALLTLTSVLSAAVTAAFAIGATIDTPKVFPLIPLWLILILVFYIAINLLRSLWATVNGLIRRGYKQLQCTEIIPREGEDNKCYKVRILSQQMEHIQWNEWVLDQKVSQMAVAHEALRNALAATGGVILTALAIAVFKLL
jgi:hypothetical protein